MTEPTGLLDNQSPESGNELSVLDLVLLLVENARLLIIGPLLAGIVALGLAFLITPTFTARTTIMPPQERQSLLHEYRSLPPEKREALRARFQRVLLERNPAQRQRLRENLQRWRQLSPERREELRERFRERRRRLHR